MQGRRAVVPHAAQPGPHHHGDQAGQPEARTGTVPLLEKYQVPVPYHQFCGSVSFDTDTDQGSSHKKIRIRIQSKLLGYGSGFREIIRIRFQGNYSNPVDPDPKHCVPY